MIGMHRTLFSNHTNCLGIDILLLMAIVKFLSHEIFLGELALDTVLLVLLSDDRLVGRKINSWPLILTEFSLYFLSCRDTIVLLFFLGLIVFKALVLFELLQ